MMAAAYKGKTVKQWLMDLARGRLAEMEKEGAVAEGEGVSILPLEAGVLDVR